MVVHAQIVPEITSGGPQTTSKRIFASSPALLKTMNARVRIKKMMRMAPKVIIVLAL